MKNSLYWRISLALLLPLLFLGGGFIWLTSLASRQFLLEANQRLYGHIAAQTVKEVHPLVNGEVDTVAIKEIMHSMMVINPSVEVYLLDTLGHVITYVAPHKTVQLDLVDTAPIRSFLANPEQFILGDDPRHPGTQNVFSAAPLTESNRLDGYIYIILASDEQTQVTTSLFESYLMRMGAEWFLLTLLVAFSLGLLALWLLTRNLRHIIHTVKQFSDGDHRARVHARLQGDLHTLASTFNQMADSIEESIENLRSVENLRKELIANISHDLRTPLSITRGYVETLLMKGTNLTQDQQESYLRIILQSSEKLSRLISQLFEYSKLEALQVEPHKEPFHIGELAQDVLARYQILAREKKIALHADFPEHLPMIHADVALVERVFQNLLDNALKFTPAGGSISLEIVPRQATVEVRVADTGSGIPEADQQLIFERFRQASGTHPSLGTGLGLAIVKRILELHQSAIRVENRALGGAVFSFQLPVFGIG